jgi:hypothetical protein
MGVRLDEPQPLKGPIDLGALLFVGAVNRDIFRVKHQWLGLAFAVIGALGLGGFLWWAFGEGLGRREDDFWVLSLLGWLGGEALSWIWAAKVAWVETSRWRQQGGLAELSLTLLRPLRIGQLVLVDGMLPFCVFCALLFGVVSAGMLHQYLLGVLRFERLYFIIPFLLIGLNGVITFYACSWAALALTLGLHFGHALWAYLVFLITLLLCCAPVLVAFICTVFVMGDFLQIGNQAFIMIIGLQPFFALGLWGVKLLFARAFAAKIEQTIVPQLDF